MPDQEFNGRNNPCQVNSKTAGGSLCVYAFCANSDGSRKPRGGLGVPAQHWQTCSERAAEHPFREVFLPLCPSPNYRAGAC